MLLISRHESASSGTPRGRLGVTWRLPGFNIARQLAQAGSNSRKIVCALPRVFLQVFLARASLAFAALPVIRTRRVFRTGGFCKAIEERYG
jgi:hypothetical protein